MIKAPPIRVTLQNMEPLYCFAIYQTFQWDITFRHVQDDILFFHAQETTMFVKLVSTGIIRMEKDRLSRNLFFQRTKQC